MRTDQDSWNEFFGGRQAEAVRSIRRRLGLTQAQLAKRLKVTTISVVRWEARSSTPSPEHLRALARLYAAMELRRVAGRAMNARRRHGQAFGLSRSVSGIRREVMQSLRGAAELWARIAVDSGDVTATQAAWRGLFRHLPARFFRQLPAARAEEDAPLYAGHVVGAGLEAALRGLSHRAFVAAEGEFGAHFLGEFRLLVEVDYTWDLRVHSLVALPMRLDEQRSWRADLRRRAKEEGEDIS
jgi:transcriptional regulator with XRE-family HTH domain